MVYEIEIEDDAEEALRKLPKRDQARIEEKIASLAGDPRPEGSIKLKTNSPPLSLSHTLW